MSAVQINILAEFNLTEKLKLQQGNEYEGKQFVDCNAWFLSAH